MLSTRQFASASQIESALPNRFPAAASRSKEIFEIITEARQSFRNASTAESTLGSSASGTDPVASATATIPSTRHIVDDVWADFTSTSMPEKPITSAATPKSSLFGSTISSKSKPKSSSSSIARPKGKKSALFGSTISARSSKAASPSYEEVSSRIFQDLVPSKETLSKVAAADEPVEAKPTMPQPLAISSSHLQSIPSSDAFDQTAISQEIDSSELHEPSPPKRPKTEEIVQVKKSSKSKPKSKSTVDQAESSISKRVETPGSNWGSLKPTLKTKKRTADVPEFDYSTAPNLLDNPKSGIKDQDKKKKKKEKKERKGLFFLVLSCRYLE